MTQQLTLSAADVLALQTRTFQAHQVPLIYHLSARDIEQALSRKSGLSEPHQETALDESKNQA